VVAAILQAEAAIPQAEVVQILPVAVAKGKSISKNTGAAAFAAAPVFF